MSWKKIIVILVVLVILGSGLITYLWYQAREAGGLDIVLTAPDSIEIGVPFTAKVAVSNTGGSVSRETLLSLSLPDGLVFMSESAGKRVLSRSLGSLGEGTITNQEFRIMPVGSENSLLQLRAVVSYIPTNLGTRFEKQTTKDISVAESGVALDIAVPQKVFSGEQFEIEIQYENRAAADFTDLSLAVEYPRGFTFISSSLNPDEGETLWRLGDLRAGSKGQFTIKGTLNGPDNAFFDFTVAVHTVLLGQEYAVNQKTASLSLSPSPLSLQITVNDAVEYIAEPGQTLTYKLSYRNNTDIGLKDVVISAKLIGTMFDLEEIDPRDGAFRSTDNTIIWNAAGVPALQVVPSGASGSVRFTAQTLPAYPIRRISDKNFILKVTGEIESPTVPQNVSSNRTIGGASIETRMQGELISEMSGFFKDSSGIANTGALPLRVGQPTTFNLHWTLKNTATDMDAVSLKTFLGPNVRYTGQYKASNNIAPSYNERTQELTWDAGKIPATKGIIGEPVTLVFQVEVTPSSNQINRPPLLTGDVSIKAKDLFTSESFFDKLESFTTILIKDPSIQSSDLIVQP